jgi:TorA maturation chaperone TorD
MQAHVMTPMSDLERAATARLLSIGLTGPDAATVGELRDLAGALAEGAGDGDPILLLAQALADDEAVADLPFAFEEIFGGEVPCPPYEGSYERDPFRGTRQMADAAGFYRAFGAGASGPAAERPDHIACQLEFVAFLVARRMSAEAASDTDTVATCTAAGDAFLRAHLGRFMGVVCTSIAVTTQSPIYLALAQVGAAFIEAELAARNIEPGEVRRPAPTGVEGDEVTCGGCALVNGIDGPGPTPTGRLPG